MWPNFLKHLISLVIFLSQMIITMMTTVMMMWILLFLFQLSVSLFLKDFIVLVFQFCSEPRKLPTIKTSLLSLHIVNFVVLISLRKFLQGRKETKFFLVSLLRYLLLPYCKWFQDKLVKWLKFAFGIPRVCTLSLSPFVQIISSSHLFQVPGPTCSLL